MTIMLLQRTFQIYQNMKKKIFVDKKTFPF